MNQETPNTALDISVLSLPLSTEEIFGNNNNSALEIGFGEGEFIAEVAANNPDWNYLGIEIKYFRYKKALKLVMNQNIRNIKLIHFDAGLAVEQVFVANTFDTVFINFPDPWPKDRHKKHRIINNNFLDNLYNILKKQGRIEFTSDHFDYVTHTIEHFDSHNKFLNIFGKQGYSHLIENRPQTKFEKDFLDKKRQIYYLSFKKL